MGTGVYTTKCTNCYEELSFEEALAVGQMVKCSLCDAYMQILGMVALDEHGSDVVIKARRVTKHEAQEMGYE